MNRESNEKADTTLPGVEAMLARLEQDTILTASDSHTRTQLVVAMVELGDQLDTCFQENKQPQFIELVIRCQSIALKISRHDDPTQTSALTTIPAMFGLGSAYSERFELFGGIEDIDDAIKYQSQAVSLTPDGHTDMLRSLNYLGFSHRQRFERLGEVGDVEKAIEYFSRAVSLTPDDNTDMSAHLSNLGTSYWSRFGCLGQMEDLKKAIESHSRAVAAASDDTRMPTWLNNLSFSYQSRFEHLGEMGDLERAIEHQLRAVSLTPYGDADLPKWSNNLGHFYWSRFQHLGQVEDLQRAIEYQSRAISLTPDGHPDMPISINSLGVSHQSRFERLGQVEDIEKAIEYHSQAVSLTPDRHVDMPTRLNNLGLSYQKRFERLGQVDDLEKAIECLSRGVIFASEGHVNMATLLDNLGLAYQSRFEHLGQVEDLEKTIKYKYQAVSLTPDRHVDMPLRLNNLGISYQKRFERLGQVDDLEKAIESLSRAVSLTPDKHSLLPTFLSSLGLSHQSRFERLGKVEDLEKAIEYQSRAVSLTPYGHADLPPRLTNLGISHQDRFQRHRQVEDLEKAIDYQSRAIPLTPDKHPNMPTLLNNLGLSHQARFEHLRQLGDLEKAIEHQLQAVSLTPNEHPKMPIRLDNLGVSYQSKFEHLGQLDALEKSIEYHSRAVSLAPDEHPEMPMCLNHLGISHQSRFDRLGTVEDLDKAIDYHFRAVSLTPDGHAGLPLLLNNLGFSYKRQYYRLRSPDTLDRCVGCFQQSALSLSGRPHLRFRAALSWAELAPLRSPSETLTAFQTAIDLIPHVVWLGKTIAQRYDDIPEIGNLATTSAAAAISAGEYNRALEWLEQARSVVWNQTLQLRTPVDELSSAHPELAAELQSVATELHNAASQSKDVIILEQAVQRHRHLAGRYDELVNKIRSIDGFEDFLRPKKVSALLRAAQTGPVVVINVHESRCDALILLPDRNKLGHVPLPDFSPAKAHQAHGQLRQSLHGLRERGFKIAVRKDVQGGGFSSALNMLWTDVVQPILDYLQYTPKSDIADLPHITWCTTGPLTFLPLHAAGSFTQSQTKLSDYAVSSYTPTLSALLSASSVSPTRHSSVLSVGQENTPGHNPLPMTREELANIQNRISPPLRFTKLDGGMATPDAILTEMVDHDWIHFACHAYQDRKHPIDSGFILHEGVLSLGSIMQKSFTNKGLAFLSACQTATGDEELPDEAVHLASGMLLAGYPSIIATMWSVVDEDAPVIADKVYVEIVRNGKMDHTKAARALHLAVKELREKVGETEFGRWVPYIHIGI
ncbi:Aromatic di-alanine and TPR containing protein [Ceratobasidium theobromae]|uniref:Aromatic di-alanine and TPR containing protein n=1 Tax=Ceratobasidium theobromae TaxID=1582974 RepID=A0A5N5QHI4_9AGAM|nr:Aromatic di-alanine and TPR containing protein [Ceratobasidium theobromae]